MRLLWHDADKEGAAVIVVIEGIDRVGKTTLCNKLQEIGCKVFKDDLLECLQTHNADEKAIMATSSMNTLVNFAKLFKNEIIILDRFHATELVYSVVDRKVNNYSAMTRFLAIESELKKLENDYLYVFVEPTDIEWSSQKHGKDLSFHETFFEVIYEDIIDEKNKMKVNFNSLDEVITKIKNLKGE